MIILINALIKVMVKSLNGILKEIRFGTTFIFSLLTANIQFNSNRPISIYSSII